MTRKDNRGRVLKIGEIQRKYLSYEYRIDFEKEKYEQGIVVSPHICRHTFCSNCAAGGMPPKSLQILMGHASFQISMDVYSGLEFLTVKTDFARVAASL